MDFWSLTPSIRWILWWEGLIVNHNKELPRNTSKTMIPFMKMAIYIFCFSGLILLQYYVLCLAKILMYILVDTRLWQTSSTTSARPFPKCFWVQSLGIPSWILMEKWCSGWTSWNSVKTSTGFSSCQTFSVFLPLVVPWDSVVDPTWKSEVLLGLRKIR